ncbi:MAG: NEAT domain-containing protein [Clostridia bacterium]|nr:NEAT domain-containing protein [Clostridia bacterium]
MKRTIATVLALVMMLALSVASFAVDPDSIPDGTYTVNIQLWHATKDKASMAQVLADTATVEVKDGQKTMTVQAKQMEMMGIKGDLVGLRVSDGKGGYTDAEVVAKDSKGLPTAFRFAVVDCNNGYIPIQEKAQTAIPVDAMNDWQDARIKVDCSSLSPNCTTCDATSTGVTETLSADGKTKTVCAPVDPAPETDAVTSASRSGNPSSADTLIAKFGNLF